MSSAHLVTHFVSFCLSHFFHFVSLSQLETATRMDRRQLLLRSTWSTNSIGNTCWFPYSKAVYICKALRATSVGPLLNGVNDVLNIKLFQSVFRRCIRLSFPVTSFILLNPVSVKQPMSSLMFYRFKIYNAFSSTMVFWRFPSPFFLVL